MSERRAPLMADLPPPVTRARTLVTVLGPLKVADSPARTLKSEKEWKRFGPNWRPRVLGMEKFGPARVCRAPNEPSVFTCPSETAGTKPSSKPQQVSRREGLITLHYI